MSKAKGMDKTKGMIKMKGMKKTKEISKTKEMKKTKKTKIIKKTKEMKVTENKKKMNTKRKKHLPIKNKYQQKRPSNKKQGTSKEKSIQKLRTDKQKKGLQKNKQKDVGIHHIPFRKQMKLEKVKKQEQEFNDLLKKVKNGDVKEEDEKKCIFALRNNIICLHYKTQEILKKLNLETPFTGVLMMNTKNNLEQLFLVKPFLCYGYINRSNFINLMSKSLRLQFEGKENKVKGNEFIEQNFKDYNFHCFEDLCNYIYTCENDAENIINKHFLPFNFTFLRTHMNLDFLQIEPELVGYLKEKMNNVLEKIC